MSSIQLTSYFEESRPVKSYVEELSDVSAIPDYNTKKVNELCLGLSMRLLINALEDIHAFDDAKKRPLTATERLAFECLGDTRSTAALLKELMFETRFSKPADGEVFEIADLGSGPVTLTIGAIIAAQRKGIAASRINCFGYDQDEGLLTTGRKVLNELGVHNDLHEIDIRDQSLYTDFLAHCDIRYWISETFRKQTPVCTVQSNGLIVSDLLEFDHGDPLPQVLAHLSTHVPNFVDNVRSGKSALFPDIVNGHYRPNGCDGTINLQTSQLGHRRLSSIGDEFNEYEVFWNTKRRWPES